MTSIEDELIKIINMPGTKADRARALYDLGCEKADVVELLNMNYSQALTIWKERERGYRPGPKSHTADGVSRMAAVRGSDRGSHARPSPWTPDLGSGTRSGRGHAKYLRLSPSQVRYITQDGHVVVRVDGADGATCAECRQPVIFTLQHLGFVHTFSKSPPTDIEDHYNG